MFTNKKKGSIAEPIILSEYGNVTLFMPKNSQVGTGISGEKN